MRGVGDHYKYIAVFLDDLAIVSKDPAGIIRVLNEDYKKFKLEGAGPIDFRLGCDFFHDEEGALCFAPRKYIDKLVVRHEQIFGSKPKTTKITLPLSRHPLFLQKIKLTANWLDKPSTVNLQEFTGPSDGAVVHKIDPTQSVTFLVQSASQMQSPPLPMPCSSSGHCQVSMRGSR